MFHAGKSTGTGRYENDPNALVDALRNNELVHMTDAEELACLPAAETTAHNERMRSEPLHEGSGHGRFAQLFALLKTMLSVAGGKLGLATRSSRT